MRFDPEEHEPFYEDHAKPIRIFVDTSDGLDAYRVVLGKTGKDQVYLPYRVLEEVCSLQMDGVQVLHRLKRVSSDIRSTLAAYRIDATYLQAALRRVKFKREQEENKAIGKTGRHR